MSDIWSSIDLNALEKRIGYSFQDRSLLHEALTHSSYANESPEDDIVSNERMEFLGDAVLGLVISEILYNRFDKDEGILTSSKSHLVSAKVLAPLAKGIELDSFLLLSVGEKKNLQRSLSAVRENSLEALIAAVYMDGGLDAARQVIESLFEEELNSFDYENIRRKDYKSYLQEYLQGLKYPLPHYKIVDDVGPPHAKIFTCQIEILKKPMATGKGKTKKLAEQNAAQATILALENGEIFLPALED